MSEDDVRDLVRQQGLRTSLLGSGPDRKAELCLAEIERLVEGD